MSFFMRAYQVLAVVACVGCGFAGGLCAASKPTDAIYFVINALIWALSLVWCTGAIELKQVADRLRGPRD